MADSKRLLTQAGYDKLQEELDDLKINSRKEIAEKIGFSGSFFRSSAPIFPFSTFFLTVHDSFL